MIVLDTNVISEIFRPRPEERVIDWIGSLTGEVAITSVTLTELLAGVRQLPSSRRKIALTTPIEAALEPYRGSRSVLPFDDLAADRYANVLIARESAGSPISTANEQIAAICLVHCAFCATRNVKDFTHESSEGKRRIG